MQDPSGMPHVGLDESQQEVDQIDNLFTYHSPTPEQAQAYLDIRTAAKSLARVIDRACPRSPDKSAAMRKLREAVMTANASIATKGGHYG